MVNFSFEEIRENRNDFLERLDFYRKYGIDEEYLRKSVVDQLSEGMGTVLEIGTGKGHLAALLSLCCDKVVSVDIDEDCKRIAALNAATFGDLNKIEFITADAGELDWPDRSFDTVVSSFAFHHMELPFKIIREMMRLAVHQIVISDYSDKAFSVIDQIHELRGKTHKRKPNDFTIVGYYLKEFNFDVEVVNDEWQVIYSAKRR